MAKKSEIIGEYIVTIGDNYAVSVSRIYRSTMKALAEIAAANGIKVLESWNTQQLGRMLLSQFCNGEKEGTIGEYAIERERNDRMNVLRTYANTMKGLREVAEVIGYAEDYKKNGWNTQDYGRHLVNYYHNLKDKR